MNETNKSLSIIAYFLSEYDMKAVTALGFENRTQAFTSISKIFSKNNNYLKFRRDEFDALPTSSSKRKGWNKRAAANDVMEISKYFSTFTFDELYNIVKALIDNKNTVINRIDNRLTGFQDISETEIEYIVNFEDESASITEKSKNVAIKVYNRSIIKQLKNLYKHKCQICDCKPLGSDICEAHHIEYFSKSKNNDASNIIILCPNHHRLIHKYKPVFNRESLQFEFEDGRIEKIKNNYHL